MNGEELSAALRAGQRVFGTLIVSPSPRWPQAVRGCGLDFVFIDTEHIALDREQLSWMCQTYAALGMAPIVRIPSPDPFRRRRWCWMAARRASSRLMSRRRSKCRRLRGAVKLRPIKGATLASMLAGDEPEPELAPI